MADDAQPQEGQGSEATGSPYDSYLSTVPDDARPAAEAWFKDTSKGLDAKLQEAAELQKRLGPYQKVERLSKYQPEQLDELLGWHEQVTTDDQAFESWFDQLAQERGYTKAQAEAVEDEAEAMGVSPERMQQIIDERLEQKLGPVQQQQEQFQRQQAEQTIEAEIHSELARLEKESGETFSESIKKMILDLGEKYEGDSSWVQHGYDRLKEGYAQGAKAFVADKTSQPRTAVTAGGNEAFKPPKDFGEAKEMARELWRQSS